MKFQITLVKCYKGIDIFLFLSIFPMSIFGTFIYEHVQLVKYSVFPKYLPRNFFQLCFWSLELCSEVRRTYGLMNDWML